jgi:NADPH:quinone reductase-like Zn-dependent oxidoreductase
VFGSWLGWLVVGYHGAVRGCGVRSVTGPVEVLALPEPPVPGSGQLLLSVRVAGIGPWDGLLYTGGWDVGLRLPAALGVEGVGTVTAVGPEVAVPRVGDLVLAHEAPLPGGSGFWAERVLVTAAHAARCPASLDPVLAGGLPVAGLTARQALDRLEVGAGTQLLITGASGPTGRIALQLAAARGAAITATAGVRRTDQLRQLGAQRVVDSHSPDWAERLDRGFDAALVAVRGTAAAAITVLRDGGRLCSITSDAPASARGIDSVDLYVRPDADQLRQLAADAADGRLGLDVEAVRLEDSALIAQRVTAGRSGGTKYALLPS